MGIRATLLSIIAGLDDNSSGEIMIGDRLVNGVAPKDRNIAMVFQSYALYPTMSVERNIGFGLEMRGVNVQDRKAAITKAADLLQVTHLLDRKPANLSGGQRQRVAMGRAIVRDPELFLFDEPLSNLDAKLRVEMRTEIKRLHERLGATIVYVTHDQVEAMTLATKVAVMKGGVIQQLADPRTIYEKPANIFVASFIGSPSMNFLDGRIAAGANGARFESEGASIIIGADPTDSLVGRSVVIGLRPEELKLCNASDANLSGLIDVVEPTGPDTMVTVLVGKSPVVARVSSRFSGKRGDPIGFSINPLIVHLFDRQDGNRIN